MFVRIGNDLVALRLACQNCDLVFLEGHGSFLSHSLGPDVAPEWAKTRAKGCDHAIAVTIDRAKEFSRTPNEVGVYIYEGSLWLAWDPVKDGFGLLSFIGRDGERLRLAYSLCASERLAERLGLDLASGVTDDDGITTLEYSDTMAQKTITVNISPKGETTIATSGFQGRDCQDVTRQLEQALGTVVTDKPTEEMNRTVQQQISATN